MKVKVLNISFQKYYNLKDRTDYNYYLRYAEIEPKDIFKLGDFMELSFGFIKDMQELYNQDGFITWNEIFKQLSKLTVESDAEISNRSLFELQAFRLYLYRELDTINEIEQKHLGHTPSAEEQQAGLDRFGKFKSFIQFDKLAGGNILNIDKVREIPYSICFTKLYLDSEVADYEKMLINIRSRKK
jgi:hypothetical protein